MGSLYHLLFSASSPKREGGGGGQYRIIPVILYIKFPLIFFSGQGPEQPA